MGEEKDVDKPINIFTVLVPQTKQDDFEKCMKISEAKNIKNSYAIINDWFYMIKNNIAQKGDHMLVNRSRRNFDNQYNNHYMRFDIDRINNDLQDSINSLHDVKEWERLKENKYESTNMNKVNFKNVVNLMEQTESESQKFEDGLKKIEESYESLSDNDKELNDIKTDYPKITKFCQLHVKYFENRTNIMKTFLTGLGLDVKKAKLANSDSKKQFDIENKHILDGKKTNLHNFPASTIDNKRYYGKDKGETYESVYIETQEDFDKLKELMENMKKCNENQNWSEYRKNWNDMMKIIGAPYGGKINIAYEGIVRNYGKNVAEFSFLKQNYRKIPIGNKTLYHTSKDHNLTELTPTCIINNNKRFCPEPLVYAHLSTMASRTHQDISTDKGVRVYKIVSPVDYVYQDTEMFMGSATIIRTDKPVKLKMLTQEEFDKLDNGNGK